MAQELLAPLEGGAGSVLARDRTLPLAPSLVPLFPDGALRKGSTVAIGRGTVPGATSLALALLSGPSAAGSWCVMVGTPDIGFVAAAQFGADLERLVVVPSPGAKWPLVTAALLEGLDVVFLRPPGEVRHADASRLQARARERGAVLVVLGPSWPGADVRLAVVAARWLGLQDGYGHLWGREVEVAASGRGAASRAPGAPVAGWSQPRYPCCPRRRRALRSRRRRELKW